jgi:hypothetical protein
MTSQEIQERTAYQYRSGSEADNRFVSLAIWLKEIALQMAIFNERNTRGEK